LVATRRLAYPHPQGIPNAVVAYSLKEVSKTMKLRKKKGLVCPDINGNVMSESAQNNAWKSFLNHLHEYAGGSKGAGPRKAVIVIDRITAHMLRHTYATMLFDAGVDVKSAQRFLGHTDVEVTLSIYTHLTKFKEEQAIQKLDEHIGEKKNEPEKRLLRVQ